MTILMHNALFVVVDFFLCHVIKLHDDFLSIIRKTKATYVFSINFTPGTYQECSFHFCQLWRLNVVFFKRYGIAWSMRNKPQMQSAEKSTESKGQASTSSPWGCSHIYYTKPWQKAKSKKYSEISTDNILLSLS